MEANNQAPIDYSEVRKIGLKTYCIKGISCNLCHSIDKYDGRVNKCVKEYLDNINSAPKT